MHQLKSKSVVLAIDDSPHKIDDLDHIRDKSKNRTKIKLIGVTCRGNQLIHVIESKIEVDGFDATEKILKMIEINPFSKEIRAILIDSPTLAGFNVVDPFELFRITKIPVLLIPSSRPQQKIVNIYREVFPERKKMIEILEKLPPLFEYSPRINQNSNVSGKVFFHAIGIAPNNVLRFLKYTSEYSGLPEPLRLAHLIASAQILSN